MELIDVILSKGNLNRAYKKVVANKGASGVDGVTVEELGDYIRKNKDAIVTSIRNRTYMPKPVRRVYIPKDNGKQRPLGIPTALDRTIQQAIAQPISDIYEEIFSEYSYGFRPGKSCHDAIRQALCYLNSGYEWVVDIDIEQFFDRVNHDKLIQILGMESILSKFPKEKDVSVGENGNKLSGGQKQRIAMARALVHADNVLILDEATSALDNITQNEIMKNIKPLYQDKIVIIITHRLDTISDVDKIFVMSEGRICEEGQHNELMKKGEKYYALVQNL